MADLISPLKNSLRQKTKGGLKNFDDISSAYSKISFLKFVGTLHLLWRSWNPDEENISDRVLLTNGIIFNKFYKASPIKLFYNFDIISKIDFSNIVKVCEAIAVNL